jgi:hypothetical protein
LTLEFKESNWLPEFSVSISFLLRVQPFYIILPLEVRKNIFGNFEPAELIGGKDKPCFNRINLLQSFVLRNYSDCFCQNVFAVSALKSKIGLRVI